MERTSTYIKVWFWSRTDGSVPSQVANGATSIDTGTWVSLQPNIGQKCHIDLPPGRALRIFLERTM
jgi:hypothetical protein